MQRGTNAPRAVPPLVDFGHRSGRSSSSSKVGSLKLPKLFVVLYFVVFYWNFVMFFSSFAGLVVVFYWYLLILFKALQGFPRV